MNIYSNKILKNMILKIKGILPYKNINKLECKKRNEKSFSDHYGEKNNEFLSSKMEGKKKNIFLQKQLLDSNDYFFKKRKIFYIDNSIFFISGGLISLYSVFVYDFFTNRQMQIFSNFFFLLFHITRQSVNILACIVHVLFIFFQICVLYIKSNIQIK
ncbi:conserved Plasmodium protein, unknown function [Plasmodium gallinaceum]|uniref:Uncharacterized protein n=1 Tax=Plasmodium gallinaceum TaxID=5849 RepID=A0A1J1GS35_PLAGA|nr:conserved Plasmodium protein, unknown function [Plasmodium gallinaceum]CRG95287.1 conserved Plasmodium protein, unknown function [Plasmodium gallinaceum]